jgi:hypothetical protein
MIASGLQADLIGERRQTDAKSTLRQIAEPFRPVVTLAIVNLLRDRCQGLVFGREARLFGLA